MKTAISLPDPLFNEAEKLAARLNLSRSELYRRAIARFIRDYRAALVTDRLNAVYGPDPAESKLDPGLEALQDEALSEGEDW